MISFWSVLSATLWFVVVYLLLSILRDHTNFLMNHGTTAWSIAVVLTIARLLLPLDSEYMFVLRSYHLLPVVRRILDYQPVAGFSVSLLLKGLWLVGALCGLGFVAYPFVRDVLRFWDVEAVPLTPEIQAAAQRQGIKPGMICVTPILDGAKAFGLLHPTIYLPIRQYTEAEWAGIIKHEMCHIIGRDTWMKLGFLLFRCVFWWNPLVYLAEKSVNDILELRCDKATLNGMSDAERIAYMELVLLEAERTHEDPKPLVGASPFISPERKKLLLLRANEALNGPTRWDKTGVAVLLLSIILFAVSYTFILQPAEVPTQSNEDDPMFMTTSGTTYLKINSSGKYEMWIDGELKGIIPADALDDGLFQNLEVLP